MLKKRDEIRHPKVFFCNRGCTAFRLDREGHFSETRFAYAKNTKISKKNSSKTRLDEKCTH